MQAGRLGIQGAHVKLRLLARRGPVLDDPSEVAQAACEFPGVHDATVYGVAVPGTDGRAGMAAIVADENLDFAAFRRRLIRRLPHYARPLFLRVRNELPVTETLKHRKRDLVFDGYSGGCWNILIP